MATTGEEWSAAFASARGETARVYDDSMVPQLFGPWARLLAALDEAGRHALAAAVEKAAAPLVEDGMVRSEVAAHLVIAAA